ncbi:MAG: hypothetical protein HFH82_15230 [Lachnospiraceae bacterium]|nr:hypothetical protein [Lachnospiraceae bacterium]
MYYNSNNWNLIAKIIDKLLKHSDLDFNLIQFKVLEAEEREKRLQMVTLCLKKCGFPYNTIVEVYEKLILEVEEAEQSYYLMEALCYIDQKLCHQNQVRPFMVDNEMMVGPMRKLNINAEELGIIILPKLQCKWSGNGKSGDEFGDLSMGEGINQLMKYYYVDMKALGGYELQNYVINDMQWNKTREFLRIAVSPLTNGNVLAVKKYKAEKKKKIGIAGVGSDVVERECGQKIDPMFYVSKKELEKKALRLIEEAARIQADILMFPEMLGTKAMIEQCLELLGKLDIQGGKKKQPPLITLLPTVWHSEGGEKECNLWEAGNNSNNLYVACRGDLLYEEGFKETLIQQKQNPYLEKRTNTSGEVEDIKSDKKICLIHVPYLGRIVFPICADLLTKSYRKLLIEVLGATLILCPSFSKGFDEFIQLTNIGNTYGCRMIWCNSCAVRHLYKKDIPGAFQESDICCMGAHGNRDYTPVKPDAECKNGQCSNMCLFYIDIPLPPFTTKDVSGQLHWHHLIA